MDSSFLLCPLDDSFFMKQGKVHSSQIRRAVHGAWKMNKSTLHRELSNRLLQHGTFRFRSQDTHSWQDAFRFSQDRNRYTGYKKDALQMNEELKSGAWQLTGGYIELDAPTRLTVASLAYSRVADNESPNHQFLKEIFRVHMQRTYPGIEIKEEAIIKSLFGDKVRCDFLCRTDHLSIVGEMGDVALWKVMALLYKGTEVWLLPHWTRQKVNPFMRKQSKFPYFVLRRLTNVRDPAEPF